jgi:hypothetical protein
MERFVGWCIHNRATGEHVSHIPLTPSELDMSGYVEVIERSYLTSLWVPIRRVAWDCDQKS